MEITKIFLDAYIYPHETEEEIKHISTATADVFLTGEFAYKICKPVDYGFLDFSTLEKRKTQLTNEMNQNILFSPDMYEKIAKLTLKDDKYLISDLDDEGNAIEYVMIMKQMNPNHVAGEILKERDLEEHEVKSIAQELSKFHRIAPTNDDISQYGRTKYIKLNWDENFEQTENCKDTLIDSEKFESIKKITNSFIDANESLFEKRADLGKVKQCHGDCHLENVFVINGKAMFFDSLTFNKRFPCSDVASEVAFMYMDLISKGKHSDAELFLSEYLKVENDTEITDLIEFYSCYRAYIRAKIASFSKDNEIEKEKAKAYFDLAHDFANKITKE